MNCIPAHRIISHIIASHDAPPSRYWHWAIALRAVKGVWTSEIRRAGKPLRSADSLHAILLDDEHHQYPAVSLPHPTICGVGENNTAPVPATSDLHGPIPLQLAETTRQFLTAKAQVNARLQRGGATDDEKQHVSMLLAESLDKISLCACEANLPHDDLLRCESAVQGLRKSYLSRMWESRCLECGIRHSMIEKGSCKFWKAWANDAKQRVVEKQPLSVTVRPVQDEGSAHATPVNNDSTSMDGAEDDTFTPFMPTLKSRCYSDTRS